MDKKKILNELSKFPTDETKAIWMYQTVKQLEEQFEEAQDILEDKTYRFVEDFLNDGIDLPREMRKYIAIGQRYSNFIDMFKSRVRFDEGLLNQETKDLLMMARAEIKKMRGIISGTKADTLQIKKDMQNMERAIYTHEQIQLLKTDSQKKKARTLCEGITSKYKIDQILRQVRKNEKKQRI